MRVVVFGAYGLIGLAITRKLIAAGHSVVGIGRSATLGKRLCNSAEWIEVDLARYSTFERWTEVLEGVDILVNAAGALQTGRKDNVDAIHFEWLSPLLKAARLAGVRRFIQISAPGASANATTAFMRSKSAGDNLVRASQLDWVILRPGLVLSRSSYGGGQLLRMLAAIPFIQPCAFSDARVQTVSIDDLTEMVLKAINGEFPSGTDIAVVEPDSHQLLELVFGIRHWLGFPLPVRVFTVPVLIVQAMSRIADLLGWLGWRSPLRTTSLMVLQDGVTADPPRGPDGSLIEIGSMHDFFVRNPATVQDRQAARMMLLMPGILGVLSVFWIMSGVIGLVSREIADSIAASSGLSHWTVTVGAAVDIALGASLLVRSWARAACIGMIVVTLVYLIAGTAFAPELWLDPLGPYVKTIPCGILALTLLPLLETR